MEKEEKTDKISKIMSNSHPASGLSLLAESAASTRLPLTADRPNMREQLLAKAVEKKQVNKTIKLRKISRKYESSKAELYPKME